MPLSCVRCSQSHSTPNAFIVTCSECRKAWHHRCHIPPISDDELLTRVNATNVNDVDNGLDGWICRKCSRSLQPIPKPAAPVMLPVAPNKPLIQQSAPERPRPQAQSDSEMSVTVPKLKYKQAVSRKSSVRSRTSSDDVQPSLFTGPSEGATSANQRASLQPAPTVKVTNQLQTTTKDSWEDDDKSEAETKPKKKVDTRGSAKSKNKRIPPNRHKGREISREEDEQKVVEIETRNLQHSQPEQTAVISATILLAEHEPSSGNLLSSDETFSLVSNSRRESKESSVGRPESSLYTIEPCATLISDVPTPQLAPEIRASISNAAVLDQPICLSHTSFAQPSSSTSRKNTSARASVGVDATPSSATIDDIEMDDDDLYGPYPSQHDANHPISNDVEMEDDDDLYGPLPMKSDVRHDAVNPADPSHIIEQRLVPQNAPDLAQKHTREFSWIRGKRADVVGDSWDLLKRKKENDVPPRASRGKFHARPLGDRDGNLLNFNVEDWLQRNRSEA